MPLSPAVAGWLNQRGHKAVHASQVGLHKSTDSEILLRAAKENEIVITCDLDFPQLLALSEARGPAVILLRSGNYSDSQALELLDRILRSVPEQDLLQSIVVADSKRLRRTRLPLKPK